MAKIIQFIIGVFVGVTFATEFHKHLPFVGFMSGLVFSAVIRIAITPYINAQNDEVKQLYHHAKNWAFGDHSVRNPTKCPDCQTTRNHP